MADYKPVPVEPTPHMLQAACDEEQQRPLPIWSRMKAIYTAMLAAAPAVPDVQGASPDVGALVEAAQAMADAARKKLYPQPDKPNSDWAKLVALDEALAAYRNGGE